MTAVRAACLLFLGVAGIADNRKMSIPIWLIPAGAAAGIICRITAGCGLWPDALLGLIPGGVLLLSSLVTRGGVGSGDALVVFATGIFEGFWGCVMSTFFGLFLCGMAALTAMIMKRSRKHRLPFIPYLLVGYILWLLLSNC